MQATLIDRAVAWFSPRRGFERAKYRKGLEVLNYYEGAGRSSRGKAWRRNISDPNVAFRGQLTDLRAVSHDLVRNNSYAARAIEAVTNNTVGTGIVPKLEGRNATETKKLNELLKAHGESEEIDADGRHDLYGLQRLVLRTVAESGECLVRRRRRFSSDGLTLPFQLQVLEPDYLDASKDGVGANGNIIVQGVEFNAIGQRVAYWLFDDHPGNTGTAARNINGSSRKSADGIAHVYRVDRPGQVRGVPWLAPAIMRLNDLHDYEDAQLMRQRVAACFAAFITQPEFPSETVDSSQRQTEIPELQETLYPGILQRVPAGNSITFSDPPQLGDYGVVTEQSLRAVAVSVGITYECLTGNLQNVNFSSGRMGWLEMARNIDVWRWSFLIPQFCGAYGYWFLEAAQIQAGIGAEAKWDWTPPRREMIDPTSEVPALIDAIRGGITTQSAVLRENGFDPVEVFNELAKDNEERDSRGLILDCDPRKVTQAGLQQAAKNAIAPQPTRMLPRAA